MDLEHGGTNTISYKTSTGYILSVHGRNLDSPSVQPDISPKSVRKNQILFFYPSDTDEMTSSVYVPEDTHE